MAGRPAVRPNTDRFEKILNSIPIALLGFSQSLTKEHCYHGVNQCIPVSFSGKVYCEVCCGSTKKWVGIEGIH